jgi:CBS domain-containing membrane protein
LRSAVKSLDEFVDITEEQLNKLYKATVMQMRKRQLGDIRCEQVMSRDVISVKENIPLSTAWHILQNAQVKAAPVLDAQNRVNGIVTQSDLTKWLMNEMSADVSIKTVQHNVQHNSQKYVQQFQATPVGVVMSTPVTTISAERHIVEAIPMFVERKIHHLPVVDSNRVIVGMLTRTDLLTWLEQNSPASN